MNSRETKVPEAPEGTFATRFWREWLKPLLLVILVMAPFRSSFADWNDVPTGSMKPTIIEGDRVVVNKLAYDLKVPFTTIHLAQWGDPRRGDIVVLYSPADDVRLVKRVIGLPGDTIEMRDDVLFVDGKAAKYEPLSREVIDQVTASERAQSVFATEELGTVAHAVMGKPGVETIRSFGPVVVPAKQYFVMGDNRDESYDSRWLGFIDRKRIVGEAVAVAFSLDREHYFIPRGGRLFRALR
ncbi:MAG: signal peptidase I [Acidobacteriota bacterium]